MYPSRLHPTFNLKALFYLNPVALDRPEGIHAQCVGAWRGSGQEISLWREVYVAEAGALDPCYCICGPLRGLSGWRINVCSTYIR